MMFANTSTEFLILCMCLHTQAHANTKYHVVIFLRLIRQCDDVTSCQAMKVITGASKYDFRSIGSSLPLSESGTQMMLEIFASIGSATPEGSRGLLAAIPDAVDLMLKTKG